MIAVACPPPFPNGGPFAIMALVIMTGVMIGTKRASAFRRPRS